MNQIAILPAGCLVSSKDVLFSDERHIMYTSNLAVYVLNSQTFIVEKIIAVTERTIASVAVSPHDHNLLIATGRDGYLSLWKLDEEELVCRVSVQANTGFLLAWDPFFPDHCAVLMNQPNMRLLYWDTKKVGAGLSELFVIKNQAIQVTVMRWNLLVPGVLAAGCSNGMVIMFQTSAKSQKTLTPSDRSVAVTDVQWDRLSAVYLLVAYQTYISLWDTESLNEIHSFDKLGGGITAIAWMDWTAGNFVSANSKNGYLRVWNASQRQPLEAVRVAAGGLVTVYFGTGTKRAICACLDGSIVVFHMVKMQMEYCTAAGHTETIFDCSFSPASPDVLATASYDGTVKLWNVPDLTLSRTLHNSKEKCIVYACDWSPKGNMVVGCNSLGSVVIWDFQSGNEVSRYLHHSAAAYCVAWNKLDESLIASTSGDCTLVVIEVSIDPNKERETIVIGASSQMSRIRLGALGGKSHRKNAASSDGAVTPSDVKLKFMHPASVFGCAWSKHSREILVTCCLDSNVRVFNCTLSGRGAVLHLLGGHTARAFVAVWSPLLPGVLASGSDDQTVLLWKINLHDPCDAGTSSLKPHAPLKQLLGHTSNIRALVWSSELESLILSGSWDSSIRLWDAKTGVCQHVITDHSADVYAIASHPSRPFTFMSCSRDTTVRLWELSSTFDRMRMQAVFECSMRNIITPEDTPDRSRRCCDAEPNSEKDMKECPDDALITGEEFLRGIGGAVRSGYSKFPLLSGRGSRMLHKELMRLDATSAAAPSSSSSSPPSSAEGGVSNGGIQGPLRYTVSERIFLAQKFHKIFNFFSGANGSLDVMDGVLTLLALALSQEKDGGQTEGEQSGRGSVTALTSADVAAVMAVVRSPQHRLILHESEIIPRARSEARVNESGRMACKRGEISGKVEEQMRRAALLHARLGDFTKYCSIMVDLGEWTSALALAPSVSHEYWKELATRYATHLSGNSSELCVPYLVAVGSDAEAVDFYLQRRDISSALTLSKMSEARKEPPSSATGHVRDHRDAHQESDGREEGEEEDTRFSLTNIINSMYEDHKGAHVTCEADITQGSSTKRALVLSVNSQVATHYLEASRPMHSAAQLLAVGDVDSAVRVLSACGEHDLAYAVSLCMDLDMDICLVNLSGMMAVHNALPLALKILDRIEGPVSRAGVKRDSPLGSIYGGQLSSVAVGEFIAEQKGLLLSKHCENHPSDLPGDDIKKRPKSSLDWLSKAKEEEAIGCDGEAAVAYVLGSQYESAASTAVTLMSKQVRDPLDLNNSFRRMLRAVKYLRATELDQSLREQFLSYLFWFCAHEAAEIGLWETGGCILRVLREALKGAESLEFYMSWADIKYQELIFKICGGDLTSLLLLDEILSNTPQRSVHVLSPPITGHPSGTNTPLGEGLKSGDSLGDDDDSEEKELYKLTRPAPPTKESKEGESIRKAGSWTEQAAGALRNLGKLALSPIGDDKDRDKEREKKEDKLRGSSSPPRSRNLRRSVVLSLDPKALSDFVPPPPEIADILKRLRAIMVDAGCVIIAKSGGSSSAAARYLASHRQNAPSRGSDGNDRKSHVVPGGSNKEQGPEGSWGSASGELIREVQNLSTALGLPSVTHLMQSPYSSKISKISSEKSSLKTGGANAMLARSKALVRESYISTDIIAKGSLLPVANLHLKLLVSCISETVIQGAIVDLSSGSNADSDGSQVKCGVGEEKCCKGQGQGTGQGQADSDDKDALGAYPFGDQPFLAGVNEALAWLKVLPYLPNMSGEFIHFT